MANPDILICMATHDRLDYTKKALQSLKENTSLNHFTVVVDNASTDGTLEYLHEVEGDLCDLVVANRLNRYPGAACNQGWGLGLQSLPAADILCRLDNDCLMHPGWDEEAVKCFGSFPGLGQFGLIEMSDSEFSYTKKTNEETGAAVNIGPTNIGGPMMILRELWDRGLRYSEIPWHNVGIPTPQEDVLLSLQVRDHGMWFANTVNHIVTEMSFGNTADYPDYYRRTFEVRGHQPPAITKNNLIIEEGWRDHV